MRSEIYLEKVENWMDRIDFDQCSICDVVSVDAEDMLNEILQEKNFDQPYVSVSQNVIKRPSTEELPSPNSNLSVTEVFLSSKSSSEQPTPVKQKMRLLSTDSGVGSIYQEHSDLSMCTSVQHCKPLLEVAEHQNTAENERGSQQMCHNVEIAAYIEHQTSDIEVSPGSTTSNILFPADNDFNSDQDSSSHSQKSIGGMSHYFDPEAKHNFLSREYPYISHSGNCSVPQFADIRIQAKDSNKEMEVVSSYNADLKRQTDGYSGLEVMCNDMTCRESMVTVAKSLSVKTCEDNFEDRIRHRSTRETGEYIGFESLNESRGTSENGFNTEPETDFNEFQLTLEVGSYVDSIFFDSKEQSEGNANHQFALPMASREVNSRTINTEDVMDLNPTKAVSYSYHAKREDVAKSCDLNEQESSVDIEHPKSPDLVQAYTYNSDGYIINQD